MPRSDIRSASASVRTPLFVIDEFVPAFTADEMRADVDEHFSHQHSGRDDTHQVWNYGYIPGRGASLITSPDKLIGRKCLNGFMYTLQRWSIETLGLVGIGGTSLILLIPGCRQNWQVDGGYGSFTFYYFLSPNERQSSGGEILLLQNIGHTWSISGGPLTDSAVFRTIQPTFNRLVVFDSRIPHAIETLSGSMDPSQSLLVLHGHLNDCGAAVQGALNASTVSEPISRAIKAFAEGAIARLSICQGLLTLRIRIAAIGRVEECDILVDRVLFGGRSDTEWDQMLHELIGLIMDLRFPLAQSQTTVIQPLTFGTQLRSEITTATRQSP